MRCRSAGPVLAGMTGSKNTLENSNAKKKVRNAKKRRWTRNDRWSNQLDHNPTALQTPNVPWIKPVTFCINIPKSAVYRQLWVSSQCLHWLQRPIAGRITPQETLKILFLKCSFEEVLCWNTESSISVVDISSFVVHLSPMCLTKQKISYSLLQKDI